MGRSYGECEIHRRTAMNHNESKPEVSPSEFEESSWTKPSHVVFGRLLKEIGLFASITQKIIRWELIPTKLHVSLLIADRATVVIPFVSGRDEKPYFAEISHAQKESNGRWLKSGRSSNIASYSPSLGWDRDILYLHPMTEWELDETVRIIQGLKNGVSIEKRMPPSSDIPLAARESGHTSKDGQRLATIRAVFDRDGGACQLCGSQQEIHIDHKIPRARGGSDGIENLWVLCSKCNLSKSDMI